MDINEYEQLISEAEDDLDLQRDYQEGQVDSLDTGAYQGLKQNQDIYSWFWKVTQLMHPPKLIRVGNLDKIEIGNARIPIRGAMEFAQICRVLKHDLVAEYFEKLAGVISASSMAKKGWFMDLSISNKKIRERSKSGEGFDKKKVGLFNRTKPSTQSEE